MFFPLSSYSRFPLDVFIPSLIFLFFLLVSTFLPSALRDLWLASFLTSELKLIHYGDGSFARYLFSSSTSPLRAPAAASGLCRGHLNPCLCVWWCVQGGHSAHMGVPRTEHGDCSGNTQVFLPLNPMSGWKMQPMS